MRIVRAAFARVAAALGSRNAGDDIREEMEYHLELATAEYVRRGMPPADARRRALLDAGGIAHAHGLQHGERLVLRLGFSGLRLVGAVGLDDLLPEMIELTHRHEEAARHRVVRLQRVLGPLEAPRRLRHRDREHRLAAVDDPGGAGRPPARNAGPRRP